MTPQRKTVIFQAAKSTQITDVANAPQLSNSSIVPAQSISAQATTPMLVSAASVAILWQDAAIALLLIPTVLNTKAPLARNAKMDFHWPKRDFVLLYIWIANLIVMEPAKVAAQVITWAQIRNVWSRRMDVCMKLEFVSTVTHLSISIKLKRPA